MVGIQRFLDDREDILGMDRDVALFEDGTHLYRYLVWEPLEGITGIDRSHGEIPALWVTVGANAPIHC
jgi:hypothetical protein